MKARLQAIDPKRVAAHWRVEADACGLGAVTRDPDVRAAIGLVIREALSDLHDRNGASGADEEVLGLAALSRSSTAGEELIHHAARAGVPLSDFLRALQLAKRQILDASAARGADWRRIDAFFAELVVSAAGSWAENGREQPMQPAATKHDRREGEGIEPLDDLQTVLDAAVNGVLILDAQGRVRHVNRRLGEILGIDPHAIDGKMAVESLVPLIHSRAGDAEAYSARSHYLYAHLDEESLDEIQIGRPEPRTVLRYGGPIRAGDGQLLGRIQVYTDVTSQRGAERVRDEFLSLAAHELKTPITSLKGYAQLLLRAAERGGSALDAAKFGERLAAILRQVDRLTSLVDELLEVSRIQTGRAELHLESMSLDELAEGIVDRFLNEMEPGFAHAIRLRSARRPLLGMWDPNRLEQVMNNLLGNAVKYSPAGSIITLRLSRSADMAKVSIADQGIGIPPSELAKLFQPFARATNAAVGSFNGIGLGLFISRDIVTRHGGRIWVESREGKGSTFHFTLPLRRR